MGEVYRAHDTTLGRDVAIKILPDLFADDPDRLARFEREARTLASLNHPNIAQIYGLEGTPRAALVMELVDGEDLSVRLARGPMPLSRGAAGRHAGGRRGGGRARSGHHPPGPEAGQYQGAPRRHGQGARLRPGKGHDRRQRLGCRVERAELTDLHSARHPDGHDRRHGGLHGARAGQGTGRRKTCGHLGVRLCALRDAAAGAGRSAEATSRKRSPP